jgi:hypothetical protein
LVLTAKYVATVPEAAAVKASPSVCPKAKHRLWAKKVVRQQQQESAGKTPIQNAQDLLSTWPQGRKNEFEQSI